MKTTAVLVAALIAVLVLQDVLAQEPASPNEVPNFCNLKPFLKNKCTQGQNPVQCFRCILPHLKASCPHLKPPPGNPLMTTLTIRILL